MSEKNLLTNRENTESLRGRVNKRGESRGRSRSPQKRRSEEHVSAFSTSFEQTTVNNGSRDVIVNKLSVSVNGKQIFVDTGVKFVSGSRYGLMGPNGRGKSTLLHLINNREIPVPRSLQIMLVEQEQEIEGGELTCVQAVLKSHKLLQEYTIEADKLYESNNLTDAESERLQWLENELSLMDANQQEAKTRRILSGLGFPPDWQDRKTSSFSGGWRKRIALASAVFIEPDLLMLDEPTNHLDLNAVIWLEDYLAKQYNSTQKRPKTLIVVSHDADFIDQVCDNIVNIENFRLHYSKGSLSQFEERMEQNHIEADREYDLLQIKIANVQKAKKFSNKQKDEWVKEEIQMGRIDPEFLEKRKNYRVIFPLESPYGDSEAPTVTVVSLKNVSFNYPNGPILFDNVDFSLDTKSRITICGPNGVGKSTFINLCTGLLQPTKGHVERNAQMRIGRYTQHFVDSIPLEKTPIQYLMEVNGVKNEFEARKILGTFGLESKTHEQKCNTLSGGQKARVALASISVSYPHFILFDEPTNHLDIESIEALCTAINNFNGGVLVVTHDARLIERTNMNLWIVGNRNIKQYKNSLENYKLMIHEEFMNLERQREEAVNHEKLMRDLKKKQHETTQREATQEKPKANAFLSQFKRKPRD